MDIKRVEPSFGMAVKKNPGTPAIESYLKNLPCRTFRIFREIIHAERNNPIDVYIGAYGPSDNKLKFVAEVGGKNFKENILFGPVTTLKRAVKRARKIQQENAHIRKVWGSDRSYTKL